MWLLLSLAVVGIILLVLWRSLDPETRRRLRFLAFCLIGILALLLVAALSSSLAISTGGAP